MPWVPLALAAVQIGYGAIKKGQANKASKKALAERKPYQTPDEVYQQLNAITQNAQGDTAMRDYATGEVDKAFSQDLQAATLLGADPNDAAALFQKKMDGIIKIGAAFHATNTEAFGKYIGALDLVAQNKTAEQISADNMIKDRLQAAQAEKDAAQDTINSGIDMGVTGLTAYYGSDLYKDTAADKAAKAALAKVKRGARAANQG